VLFLRIAIFFYRKKSFLLEENSIFATCFPLKKINMKFKAILFSLLCMAMTALYAAPVSPSVALQVASNFYAVNAGKSGSVSLTDVTSQSGFQEFYIFVHPQGKGFVIVAADDCVQPIIGYSLSTSFVFPLPAHVQAQLQGYEEEIAYYKSAGIRATSEIIELWESMQNGSYTPRNTTSVSPMLTTTWNQSPYYNNLCPDSAGIHAVTGCTATATAQVMKYWNWPATGTGSHTYTDDNFGTLSANFGATTYQWSSMPNALNSSSTTAQINAVATLMFHVGVAVEMDYGIGSSGAYTNSYGYSDLACSENALKDYFGYKSTTIHSVYKNNVTDAVWVNVLTAEMDAGRPVIESGHGGGGHAFVCDGYDNNGLFHINWGWGSAYDGYFAHNALNPGGGGTGSGSMGTYNQDQSLVVGIEPAGLHTSTQYLTLPQEGGTTSFTVSSNMSSTTSWTASCNQPWLTVSPTTGYGSGVTTTVNVTATANNTGAVRLALVTITQGTQSATVTVSQNECATSDMCQITLEMNDSYGDGWNGSYLTLSSSSGFVYGTATFNDGNTATQQFSVCPSGLILSWTSGSQWDNECSFVVNNASGQSLLTVSQTPTGTYSIANPCAGGTTCEVNTFPWTESFEGDIDCWTVIDADGDGYNWERTYGGTHDAYGGNYMMFSRSIYCNTVLNTENYLISPQITLPSTGNYQLVFYAASSSNSNPDSILVKLSTTSNASASAFTTTLMPKTMIPHLPYQQYTINLSGYNGQSFYLAFVHESYNCMYLYLDNISIVSAPQSYTITATSANNSMGTVTGGGTYTAGASVSLEATANAGYRFTGWDDGNTDNPRNITAMANASYTAYFADLGTGELHYDNGTLVNSMGAGGTLYWAVRFPANVLSSYTTLSSVRLWDMYAGSYQVSVCQGGTNAPGTQLASQTFSLNGTGAWFDATFSSPLTIDPTQALWIVLYNTGVNYPAAASTYAGNPDGSWVSLNGNDWNSICNYDYDLTWMIRPVLSAASTPQTYTITAISSNDAMGTVYGGGPYTAGTTVQLTANAAPNHHFVSWNDGNTSNPRYITVTGNATYIANFAVDQYQITVLSGNDAMGTVTGGGLCDYGSVVQIQAYPSAGYEFVYWNDGNTDNPRDITVTGNATYVANFQPTVGIDGNNLSAVSVYSHDHQIVVCHAEGKSIEIYDVLGKLVAYDTQNSQELRQFTISTKGIYLVRVGEAYFKKVVVN
jgi:hypothetical protein